METPLALGDISKVQLWSGWLFTLMVLEHACSQTPEQLGCLRASGEETAKLAILQWWERTGGWGLPASSVPPSTLKGLVPARGEENQQKELQGQTDI